MVEVVPTVLLVCFLPFVEGLRLMLHHYAFLELGIEVNAPVSLLRHHSYRIQLFLAVLLRVEHVIRNYGQTVRETQSYCEVKSTRKPLIILIIIL